MTLGQRLFYKGAFLESKFYFFLYVDLEKRKFYNLWGISTKQRTNKRRGFPVIVWIFLSLNFVWFQS